MLIAGRENHQSTGTQRRTEERKKSHFWGPENWVILKVYENKYLLR